jgi:hypothetical protein
VRCTNGRRRGEIPSAPAKAARFCGGARRALRRIAAPRPRIDDTRSHHPRGAFFRLSNAAGSSNLRLPCHPAALEHGRRGRGASALRAPQRRQARMSTLISLLITVLVIVLVLYLVNMLPLDRRMRQIVQIIVIIIGILSLLRYIAVF